MAAKKGHIKQGGRLPGSLNIVSSDTRTVFKLIVEGQLDNVNTALDQLLLTNPKGYIDCLINLAEYFIPKLVRTELVGDKENPINFIPINFVE